MNGKYTLPPDLRALIDKESGVAGAVSFGKVWETQEKVARDLEISKKGLEIITLPDGEVAKLKQIGKSQTQEAIAALEKQGKPARQFLDEYTK
jgi:hypothetical protein